MDSSSKKKGFTRKNHINKYFDWPYAQESSNQSNLIYQPWFGHMTKMPPTITSPGNADHRCRTLHSGEENHIFSEFKDSCAGCSMGDRQKVVFISDLC